MWGDMTRKRPPKGRQKATFFDKLRTSEIFRWFFFSYSQQELFY